MISSAKPIITYEEEQQQWRHKMEASLGSKDGWLTVVGLEWLKQGENIVGSGLNADVKLPPNSAPELVGMIDFDGQRTSFRALTEERITFNGESGIPASLQDDSTEDGPTLIQVRSVTFFMIHRGAQVGIRIKDTNSLALQNFTGRHWFPVNIDYQVLAKFTAHDKNKPMSIENSIGTLTTISNPGTVEFDLHGERCVLEAFQETPDQLWLMFRDSTSGDTTYPAARYLKVPFSGGAELTLDFNQAYHPPCAFTDFATCPFPPRQNWLPVAIQAGERL